jgi:hypothetical protein
VRAASLGQSLSLRSRHEDAAIWNAFATALERCDAGARSASSRRSSRGEHPGSALGLHPPASGPALARCATSPPPSCSRLHRSSNGRRSASVVEQSAAGRGRGQGVVLGGRRAGGRGAGAWTRAAETAAAGAVAEACGGALAEAAALGGGGAAGTGAEAGCEGAGADSVGGSRVPV